MPKPLKPYRGKPKYDAAYARLLAKVEKKLIVPELGECWIYTGTKTSSGHSSIFLWKRKDGRSKVMSGHRLSFIVNVGMTRKHLCHKCHQRDCVRDDHLYAGTQAQNMADMMNAQRGKNQFSSTYQPHREDEECPF